MRNNRIVVFGADGFLGKHLVTKLAADPTNKVIAFDRFSEFTKGIKTSLPFREHNNVSIIKGDFFNRDDIENILKKDDYVFHLVSSTNPASSIKDPLIDVDTNIRGSVELLKICTSKKIQKVIYFSSGGTVYGNTLAESINEDSILKPLSPYGIGKVTVENYLNYFYATHKLDYTVFRISNPFGPGQNIYGKQGVIPIFLRHFLEKTPIEIFGDGTMVRDYIYIDELTNMITASFKDTSSLKTYNLGSGTGVSINELIAIMEKITGYRPEKIYKDFPPAFVQKSVLDIERFKKEFDYTPDIKLEQGIERTWSYVKSIN